MAMINSLLHWIVSLSNAEKVALLVPVIAAAFGGLGYLLKRLTANNRTQANGSTTHKSSVVNQVGVKNDGKFNIHIR